MTLSPREMSHFCPETLSPLSGQRFEGSVDFRNLALGIPKFSIFPQSNSNGFYDHNIALLLQQWLLSTLRGVPSLLPNSVDFHARNFPPNASVTQPITGPYKQDFMLQDLHEKYKKLLGDYELAIKQKISHSSHLNDIKSFDSKLRTPPCSTTVSSLPFFNNPLCFSFPSPSFHKYPKPLFSSFPNQFYPMPSPNISPHLESTSKAMVHNQSDGLKEELTSLERPQTVESSKDKKTHKCMYCGKLYSRKYGLKIHIRTHTGYKPLKCKVCGRPFGDPSNLNKHVRLHAEGDTPYRCEFCGKVLVRRRDLERHIKSRHPSATCKVDMFSM